VLNIKKIIKIRFTLIYFQFLNNILSVKINFIINFKKNKYIFFYYQAENFILSDTCIDLAHQIFE